MAPSTPPLRRHESDSGWTELVVAAPHPRLRPFVKVYEGYDGEWTAARQVHTPSGEVPVIFGFGSAVRSSATLDGDGAYNKTFVAGQYDRASVTEYAGESRGVQVNFTAIGAYQFLGVPMDMVANRVVELEDIFGPAARRLVEQLESAAGWEARFDLLDTAISERMARTRPVSEGVAWAWHKLQETGGRVRIDALTTELGCSRKHLVAQFREQIGLPPKTLARVLRFDRAVRLLDTEPMMSWTAMALRCGYYDQAHFNRDFREFSGTTPGEFVVRRATEDVHVSNELSPSSDR